MKECLIDGDRAIITNDQSVKVGEPGESPFHFPAPPIPSQCSAILRAGFAAIPAMRCNQFDSSHCQPLAQRVAVIGPIGNHTLWFLTGPVRHELAASPESRRAFLPPPGLRSGRQSKAAFPMEYPGHRPPLPRVSSAEKRNRACRARFSQPGHQEGDRIGIWSINSSERVITQFATAKIGAILVNIDPLNRACELRHVRMSDVAADRRFSRCQLCLHSSGNLPGNRVVSSGRPSIRKSAGRTDGYLRWRACYSGRQRRAGGHWRSGDGDNGGTFRCDGFSRPRRE